MKHKSTIPASVVEIAVRRAANGYWDSWFECERFLHQWLPLSIARDLTVTVFDLAKHGNTNELLPKTTA